MCRSRGDLNKTLHVTCRLLTDFAASAPRQGVAIKPALKVLVAAASCPNVILSLRSPDLCTKGHFSSVLRTALLSSFKESLQNEKCYIQGPGADDQPKQTVYTVRMCTGAARGSGMTEERAGVLLGLVGHGGSCFIQKVDPLADPDAIEQQLYEICKVLA